MTSKRILANSAAVAILVCLVAPVGIANAQFSTDVRLVDPKYSQCLDAVRQDPIAGLAHAQAWQLDDGGLGAAHCIAAGQFAVGLYAEAAAGLEELVTAAAGFSRARQAKTLGQAATAWFLADNNLRARDALDRALALTPDDIGLRLTRSEVHAAAGNYFGALDDLDHILAAQPDMVEALVFRATTYRRIDTPELAWDDVARALTLAPGHPDALLERGFLYAGDGNRIGAAIDWNAIIAGNPDSVAAQLARGNLVRLDAEAHD